jgi:UDP:flavonoid glycosyltransferase YjiC (YdhE family)
MRALFVAAPLVGHVLPLVPLAAAFRNAGHDVLLATAADGVGAARRAGLPVHDVARAWTCSAPSLAPCCGTRSASAG